MKNKTLKKILNPVKKVTGKAFVNVGLPLVMMAAATNYAQAQKPEDYLPGTADFEVLSVNERTIRLNSEVNPYVNHVTEKVTYTLDVLRLKHVKSGREGWFLYLGDRDWNKGDKINANYAIHKNRSDNTWTDREIRIALGEAGLTAATPENEDFYDGVIGGINSIERAYEQ